MKSPEQTTVLVSHVPADRNTLFDTDPGKDTNLRMFLLSIAEANAYFTKDDDRRCLPSPYAEAQGAKAQDGGCCMWWLRSPGYDSSAAARVLPNGSVSFIGQPAQRSLGVRPAMWVACDRKAA